MTKRKTILIWCNVTLPVLLLTLILACCFMLILIASVVSYCFIGALLSFTNTQCTIFFRLFYKIFNRSDILILSCYSNTGIVFAIQEKYKLYMYIFDITQYACQLLKLTLQITLVHIYGVLCISKINDYNSFFKIFA